MSEAKASGLVNGDSVSFRLPSPPPSMNAMYQIHYAKRQVFMKPEVRTYKTSMKLYVPKFEVSEKDKVGMEFQVFGNWYFKNGNLKKKDVQNTGKVLVDLVSEKMGFDDSQVWDFRCEKVQSEREYVMVKVWRFVCTGG